MNQKFDHIRSNFIRMIRYSNVYSIEFQVCKTLAMQILEYLLCFRNRTMETAQQHHNRISLLRVESGLEYLRRKQQLERDIMISSSPSPSHTSSDVLPYHQRPASGSSSSIMKYPSIPPQPSYPARQLVSTVRFRTDHKYYPSRNLGNFRFQDIFTFVWF